MTTWAPSRRARMERIDAEADALIRDLGDRAYQEARRREHEASSDAIAEDWALVAQAIARKTGSRVGLNLSTQLAMNTFFVLDREPGAARQGPAPSGARRRSPSEPPRRTAGVPTPQPFRIQFMGAATDSGPSHLAGRSRSAPPTCPPRSSPPRSPPGRPIRSRLRILDREGHEVFGRQKAAGR